MPGRPKAEYVQRERRAACEAYAAAALELKEKGIKASKQQVCNLAIKKFNLLLPSHTIQRPARFIQLWRKRFAKDGNLADAPGRGPKTKVSPHMAKRVAAILGAGYMEQGVRQPFANMAHALAESAELRRIQRRLRLTAATLWRRARQVEPRLKLVSLQVKMPLTDKQMQERVRSCVVLLAKGDKLKEYLRRVIWIDAKTHYVRAPKNMTGIVLEGEGPTYITHPRRHIGQQYQMVIVYYCAVSYFGPVHYKEVTGTTGLQQHYKVRAGLPCAA